MKIAITGHTSGLGRELLERLARRGHSCVGFSRSTGHDITRAEGRAEIVVASRDSDVFINNAYDGFGQTDLLFLLWKDWKDLPRTIVNVSSRSADTPTTSPNPYKIHKRALDNASRQLQLTGARCKVVCLKPSVMDTPLTARRPGKKLTPAEVCEVVEWVLDRPPHVLIPDLSMVHHETTPGCY